MDKDNVVRSSEFYMAQGDVLHILLREFDCGQLYFELSDEDGNTEGAVVVTPDDASPGYTPITFGMLYNWYAVDDARNIAPTGWRVPTLDDIIVFIATMGGDTYAGKLKETGTTYWNAPNTGATNELAFNGRGAGYRLGTDGTFSSIRALLTFHIDYSSVDGYGMVININDDLIYYNGYPTHGRSLRLIKDDSINPGYMTGNDLKVYPTVKIGNQVWMAQNSAETKYRDSSFTVGYGALYNWYAATDVREITAAGWHVPTKTEFNTLITYLGGTAVAGGKCKETGLTYWTTPNTGATNEVGFNGRGSGIRRSDNGVFESINIRTYIWTTTLTGANYTGYRLQYNTTDGTTSWASPVNMGNAIRLIKDSTTLSPGESSLYTGNDGKVYNTICIGTQEWLSENLCETEYRDGTAITEVTDSVAWAALATGAMCYYDNNELNAFTDGDDIPEVTDNTEWAALATGARCAYNNDEDNV